MSEQRTDLDIRLTQARQREALSRYNKGQHADLDDVLQITRDQTIAEVLAILEREKQPMSQPNPVLVCDYDSLKTKIEALRDK